MFSPARECGGNSQDSSPIGCCVPMKRRWNVHDFHEWVTDYMQQMAKPQDHPLITGPKPKSNLKDETDSTKHSEIDPDPLNPTLDSNQGPISSASPSNPTPDSSQDLISSASPSNPTLYSNQDLISSASTADDQTANGETDVTGLTASLPIFPSLNDGTSPVASLVGTFGPSSDSGSAVVAANPGYTTFVDDSSTPIF
ncbi:hypothetical protein MMC07_003231 [Pseudocyphellaria aurata]|nr:hypothetical protein [Pseudocyphellaria aurata]